MSIGSQLHFPGVTYEITGVEETDGGKSVYTFKWTSTHGFDFTGTCVAGNIDELEEIIRKNREYTKMLNNHL